MPSIKLTNSIRDSIIHRALIDATKKEEEALDAREDELFDAIYKEKFTDDILTKVKELPDEWYTHANWMNVINCLGQIHDINTSKNGAYVVPHKFNRYSYEHRIQIKNRELSDKLDVYISDLETFKTNKSQTKKMLRSLLYSVNTTNQLQEAWPEGKEYYSNLTTEEKISLPAVLISDINKRLGLPKEEALAA